MIELVPYSSEFKNDTIKNILETKMPGNTGFFGSNAGIV